MNFRKKVIASNTVRNWYKRYKSEETYLARKVGDKKGRVKSQEIDESGIELNICKNREWCKKST